MKLERLYVTLELGGPACIEQQRPTATVAHDAMHRHHRTINAVALSTLCSTTACMYTHMVILRANNETP
jgi:hypothetical protein